MNNNINSNENFNLKAKLIVYGCKNFCNVYAEEKSYGDALSRLQNMELENFDEVGKGLKPLSKSVVQNKTKGFFLDYFDGLDFDVDYVTPKEFEKIKTEFSSFARWLYANKIDENLLNADVPAVLKKLEEVMRKIKKNKRKTSIFNVPILNKDLETSVEGKIEKHMFLVASNDYLEKYPVLNGGVVMGRSFDALSIPTYAHEVAHALVERNKKCIRNYINFEVVSMFIEKLAAQSVSEDNLEMMQLARMAYTQYLLKIIDLPAFNMETNFDMMNHIYGAFISGVMFDEYTKAPEEQKKGYIKDIRDIFNGEKTIDKMLAERKISLDDERVGSYLDKIESYAKSRKSSKEENNVLSEEELDEK